MKAHKELKGSGEDKWGPSLESLIPILRAAVHQTCPTWLSSHVDDLVQTALVKIAEMDARGEAKQGLSSSYIWRVAHSVIVDEIRRQRRRREEALEDSRTTERAVTTAAGPERMALASSIGKGIADCLQRLPRHRRQAVTLRLLGHSIREVASMLCCQEKRANNLVYRGLAALRECLRTKGLEP